MMLPTLAFPPATPSTLHVTLVLDEFATVAAKACCCPGESVAVPGDTVTAMAPPRLTLAETLDAPAVTALAVAVIVTGFVEGKSVGAV